AHDMPRIVLGAQLVTGLGNERIGKTPEPFFECRASAVLQLPIGARAGALEKEPQVVPPLAFALVHSRKGHHECRFGFGGTAGIMERKARQRSAPAFVGAAVGGRLHGLSETSRFD